MHPRNKHSGRYDFKALTGSCPELKTFVVQNPKGDSSIDFANPAAVRTLNRALLKCYYGVKDWDIPNGYLCPPIPGRADYIHIAADLLASSNGGAVPRGRSVRIVDLGVGANCVYPLLGHAEYGWSFVGTETDPVAIASSESILAKNPKFKSAIEVRTQSNPERFLRGILASGEKADLVLCNPPFHGSREEAREGSRRKWTHLGKAPGPVTPANNFGGQDSELWYPGGEKAFATLFIDESVDFRDQCLWFTILISKITNLGALEQYLSRSDVNEVRTIDMAQGQKKSRILAWTFQNSDERKIWLSRRA